MLFIFWKKTKSHACYLPNVKKGTTHYFQVIRLELVDHKLQPWIAKKCGLSQRHLTSCEGSCLFLPWMMDNNSNFYNAQTHMKFWRQITWESLHVPQVPNLNFFFNYWYMLYIVRLAYSNFNQFVFIYFCDKMLISLMT
jgi:hypothetical protein